MINNNNEFSMLMNIINDSKFKKLYEKCFYNAVYLGLLLVFLFQNPFRPIMN